MGYCQLELQPWNLENSLFPTSLSPSLNTDDQNAPHTALRPSGVREGSTLVVDATRFHLLYDPLQVLIEAGRGNRPGCLSPKGVSQGMLAGGVAALKESLWRPESRCGGEDQPNTGRQVRMGHSGYGTPGRVRTCDPLLRSHSPLNAVLP